MSKIAKAVVGAVLVVVGSVVPGAQALIPYGYGLIVSNALDLLSQALVSKPRSRRLGQDIEYAGTVEPRRIIYGEMKVSGMNVIPPWTSGDGNKNLHQVLAIAGHECTGIDTVYFHKTEIADAAIGPVTGTVTDGEILSGTFEEKAWVRRYLGTDDQTADFILDDTFSSDWTSNHRGRSVAYAALTYELDDEVYKNGKPEVSFLVRGKKVYDPRLDTATVGAFAPGAWAGFADGAWAVLSGASAPGGDPTDMAFIAYSNNPALCLADYLLDSQIGLGEDATRIDWDLVVAAANICEEQVAIPPTSSPTVTQNRYTCNVALFVAIDDEERRENLKILCEAMMGHLVYRGGKWRMYAGAAASSTFALTEDDLVGKCTIRTETASNDKYNYVRGQLVDSAREYQLSEFEPRSNSSYESEDGGGVAVRYPREIVCLACTNQYEAQRNALIVLKRSRMKRQVSGLWGMTAFKIRPWDVGTLTIAELGWTEQLVRCIKWQFNPDGTIDATFIEEQNDVWDDPAVGDYTVPNVGGGPQPGVFTPDPPTDFTVTPGVDGINFHWNQPADGSRTYIWEHTSASPFASAVRVSPNLLGNSFFLPKGDQTTRYYWVTSQHLQSGTQSDPTPTGDGIPGAALAISAGFHAKVSSSTVFTKLFQVSSGNSASITVTPVNGVPPYTHSWARTSGDATIHANSATAATTNFGNSGMVDQEVNTAKFVDTVTDSTAATTDVEVSVTFRREDGL